MNLSIEFFLPTLTRHLGQNLGVRVKERIKFILFVFLSEL